jgi:hypothetical protein
MHFKGAETNRKERCCAGKVNQIIDVAVEDLERTLLRRIVS